MLRCVLYCSSKGEGLTLEISDLEKVESLCFDGGNEIYHILRPDWDGEDSLFDVISVEGFQNLKNLKTVEYISMCYPIVLEPLNQVGIEIGINERQVMYE